VPASARLAFTEALHVVARRNVKPLRRRVFER
jgi:hypothetical protein